MNTPDIIGTIYKPSGNMLTDSDGTEYPEQVAIEGFHVNFIKEVPELAAFKVNPQPTIPMRKYAGGIMPVCYVFADKSELEGVWEPSWQTTT